MEKLLAGRPGYIAFAILCFVWGSTWLVIKVGYGGLGPFNVAALRFFIAGAALTVMAPMMGAHWPRGREQWRLVILVGVVLFAADYGLIYWAEQWLDSGLTAILFATLPIFTALLAHFYLPGDRLTVQKLAGTLLAFAGVFALFADSLKVDASGSTRRLPGRCSPLSCLPCARAFHPSRRSGMVMRCIPHRSTPLRC
jgi:drug/metabolite transporter (DMT)-like permease